MNSILYKKYGFLLMALIGFSPLVAKPLIGVKDSIGVENKDGKQTILHKVAPKETLFAIARRYKAAVADIQKANPELAKGLAADQIVKVPTNRKFTGKTQAMGKTDGKTHTVTQGQTLFAVARQYNISVDDIKKWNSLSSNELSAGQVLVVSTDKGTSTKPKDDKTTTNTLGESTKTDGKTHAVTQGQTLFAVARQYNVSVDELKKWNNLTSGELSAGQVLVVGSGKNIAANTDTKPETQPQKEPKENVNTEPIRLTTNSKPANSNTINAGGYDRIVELGLAEVIEQGNETRKHLCLHRNAPIGSILQVKNEMNGSMVFVRVIGKLPDTGINDKLLLRISKKAYERLSASGKRFQVEVSYPAP